MLDWKEEKVKWQIADRFGYWTAQSAMRGWSQESVDCALGQLDFATLFDTSRRCIEKGEFDQWRAKAIQDIRRIPLKDKKGNTKFMPFGWAAKMIAIYLKTTCYLAGFGRDNLVNLIHPALDNNLVNNLRREFQEHQPIIQGLVRFKTIGGLSEEDYRSCIESCKLIAKDRGCTLIEVEQFWTPT